MSCRPPLQPFKLLDSAPVAQSREMTPDTQILEQACAINESVTLLGMPREIRDLIYHYIFPDILSFHVQIPAKLVEEMIKWEAADILVKKAFCKLVTWDQLVSALIRQNFMISRQIRNEVLSITSNTSSASSRTNVICLESPLGSSISRSRSSSLYRMYKPECI
jgi:hypothetical protein